MSLTRTSLAYGVLAGLSLGLLACSGSYVTVAPALDDYEVLGQATGTACGSLGIGGTAYYFIPVLINSRVERAYRRAVASVPGATALANPTLSEYWFWWVVATTRCTTITGEAVR